MAIWRADSWTTICIDTHYTDSPALMSKSATRSSGSQTLPVSKPYPNRQFRQYLQTPTTSHLMNVHADACRISTLLSLGNTVNFFRPANSTRAGMTALIQGQLTGCSCDDFNTANVSPPASTMERASIHERQAFTHEFDSAHRCLACFKDLVPLQLESVLTINFQLFNSTTQTSSLSFALSGLQSRARTELHSFEFSLFDSTTR